MTQFVILINFHLDLQNLGTTRQADGHRSVLVASFLTAIWDPVVVVVAVARLRVKPLRNTRALKSASVIRRTLTQVLRRGPRCFDCSGLVNKAWELQGVTVPWTTHGYPTSNMIRVAPSNVQPGDVLYRSGHVGMFVGNGEVVHAANTKQGVIKVKFSSFRYETIYRPRL